MDKVGEPGPHAMRPPFFQATIAKSPQSKSNPHRCLRKSQLQQPWNQSSLITTTKMCAFNSRSPGFLATVAREQVHELGTSVGMPGPHDFAVRDNAARR